MEFPGTFALIVTLAFIQHADAAQTGALTLQSGTRQTVMMELYTSEGCSSCPPAERYLNTLARHKDLWRTYIPLAFHVDYWDHLGWKDSFASPAYSERQRRYALEQSTRFVYTPAFVVNGKAWRPGRPNILPSANTLEPGPLNVSVSGKKLSARFRPTLTAAAGYRLSVALLGFGLQSRIAAGENRDSLAHHDFVVLGLKSVNADTPRWSITLPDSAIASRASRLAVVAWVSNPDSLAPIQAVAGYLPRN